MTALSRARGHRAQVSHTRSPAQHHAAGIRSNLFWLLLAPLCSLLDRHFRRYASTRDAAGEREWLTTRIQLPDAKSCTSWAARKERGGPYSPVQPTGARVSDIRLS